MQKRRPDLEVRVWARQEASLEPIRKLGFARIADTDLSKVAAGARCIVLCTPVEFMPDLVQQLAPELADDAIITDAGSVKAGVVAACENFIGGRFVGAHPIAGSERSGIGAASADLYEGATCVLTPTEHTRTDAIATVRALWSLVGCRLVELSPALHDAALARTSHLPHLAAAALAAEIDRTVSGWDAFVGGGYRDTTRIAQGSPDLWTGILMANRAEISTSIAEFIEILQNIRRALDTGDPEAVRALLAEGRSAREKLHAI